MDSDFSASHETEPGAAEVLQSVTDEELFEAYLAARLAQALDTLNRAREELAAQPEDFARAFQVMRRVHELRELRAQLEAQRARVNATRSAAGMESATAEPQVTAQATPGDAFRAAQSERADKIMAALKTQPQTCPSCQALLEPSSARCHCGYTVDSETPAANLGAETESPTRWPAS